MVSWKEAERILKNYPRDRIETLIEKQQPWNINRIKRMTKEEMIDKLLESGTFLGNFEFEMFNTFLR